MAGFGLRSRALWSFVGGSSKFNEIISYHGRSCLHTKNIESIEELEHLYAERKRFIHSK